MHQYFLMLHKDSNVHTGLGTLPQSLLLQSISCVRVGLHILKGRSDFATHSNFVHNSLMTKV